MATSWARQGSNLGPTDYEFSKAHQGLVSDGLRWNATALSFLVDSDDVRSGLLIPFCY